MDYRPHFLRISDSDTGRAANLRLEEGDAGLTVGQVLDKYLSRLSGDSLLQRRAITQDSLRSLMALQDLVYACDDRGRLTGMYSGVAVRQGGDLVDLADVPQATATRVSDTAAAVIELTVDRTNVGYDRNWAGFHRRRWDKGADFFEGFVADALERELGAAKAQEVMGLETRERRLEFVEALARRIWESEFENYSRFVGERLMFKTGDETVRNIAAGSGGICTEKVQALKFLTDHYGLESEYVIGGDGAEGPVPVEKLREMLQTFDFRFGRRYMRYWQHAALLYRMDGIPTLVDATNGNIPFLFLSGESAEKLLGYEDKPSVKVRMVEAEEDYYYHRVAQDIPQNLFFAMEGWLTDTDLVQVFENELGLYLSDKYYITPLPYRSDKEYEGLAADYVAIARRAGFGSSISREWGFDSELGAEFAEAQPATAEKILAAREHLLVRYNGWEVPGHDAGLVIFRLK